MFTCGVICVKHKTSSYCADNKSGEDICLEYGEFYCSVSKSTFNCSLYLVQSVTKAKGIRKDSYSSSIDYNVLGGSIFTKGLQNFF